MKRLRLTLVCFVLAACGSSHKSETPIAPSPPAPGPAPEPALPPPELVTVSSEQKDCEAKDPRLFRWNSATSSCEAIESFCDQALREGSLNRKSFDKASAQSKVECRLVEQQASCDESSRSIRWSEEQISSCTFDYEAYKDPLVIASKLANEGQCARKTLQATMTLERQDPELQGQSCEVRSPESYCSETPVSSWTQAGDGTAARPFVICNNDQLQIPEIYRLIFMELGLPPIRSSSQALHLVLGQDIEEANVIPRLGSRTLFHLDGNGKTLRISQLDSWQKSPDAPFAIGLYKDLISRARIENLKVVCTRPVLAFVPNDNLPYTIGILAANANNSEFRDIEVSCDFDYRIEAGRTVNVWLGWFVGTNKKVAKNTFVNVRLTNELSNKAIPDSPSNAIQR